MKRAELRRFAGNPKDRTIGALVVEGINDAVFIMEPGTEDPRGACVPEGFYLAKWINSPRFGWCWTLIGADVSDQPDGIRSRNLIRIHPGNDDDESEGCLLPGLAISWDGRDMEPQVNSSRFALSRLVEWIGDEDFLLTITSGPLDAA